MDKDAKDIGLRPPLTDEQVKLAIEELEKKVTPSSSASFMD